MTPHDLPERRGLLADNSYTLMVTTVFHNQWTTTTATGISQTQTTQSTTKLPMSWQKPPNRGKKLVMASQVSFSGNKNNNKLQLAASSERNQRNMLTVFGVENVRTDCRKASGVCLSAFRLYWLAVFLAGSPAWVPGCLSLCCIQHVTASEIVHWRRAKHKWQQQQRVA